MNEVVSPTVFFMHIMKTSGSSLTWSIRRSVRPDEVYPGGPEPERTRRYWLLSDFDDQTEADRARYRVFVGHFPWYANERFGADEVVTILRDPIERTLSHLSQIRREHTDGTTSLEELYEGIPELPMPVRNFQVRQFALTAADEGSRDPDIVDDARYRLAVERLEAVAVLGRTDHLEPLLAEVEARYGWRLTNARLQVAPERPEASSSFRRRLERDNQADLEFYAEACDLLRRRGASSC